jgi:hypothetical protein
MQHEVNEFMAREDELAKGIGDWEQRLSTALRNPRRPISSARRCRPARHATPTRTTSTRTRCDPRRRFFHNRRVSILISRRCMPVCDDTGWKPVTESSGTAGREASGRASSCAATAGGECWPSAHERSQYPHPPTALHHRQFSDTTAATIAAARRCMHGSCEQFPAVARGLFSGQPGVGKTHLAVAVLKEAAEVRRPRPLRHCDLLRHPEHLRSVDPNDRARSRGRS